METLITVRGRPMHDLDLKSLRLLVAVCEHQNMARAAKLAHIEPSAVSKRIAQLEVDLGTALLQRTPRGVQPTPAGQAVLEHARNVLFTVDRMASDAANFNAGIQGHVRMIASASAIAESLLDDVSSFLRDPANRNIKVDIEEHVSRDVVRRLREGVASVGVCWDRVELEGLECRTYRSDRLALAVHGDHPLAGMASLDFEQTLDYDHVSLAPNTAVHTMLQQAAARAGRRMTHRVIVSNFDSSFRVVASNLAVSVVPAEVGGRYEQSLGIRVIPLNDAWAKRQFIVCFTAYEGLQPAARRLVDHLAERAGQQA